MKLFSKPIIIISFLITSSVAFSQKIATDTITTSCAWEADAGFLGGIESWNQILLKKLNTGIAKKNGAPTGVYTVTVHFLITKVGSIDSVSATTHHGYGMEEEAVRVIRQAPKWAPAIKNAKNVPEWKQHSITFTVSK